MTLTGVGSYRRLWLLCIRGAPEGRYAESAGISALETLQNFLSVVPSVRVDAVLHPLHLEHPEWIPVFDMLPEQASASKHRIFDLAAEEDALVFAHHFPPYPNLGHTRKQEQGWQWQPIERQG